MYDDGGFLFEDYFDAIIHSKVWKWKISWRLFDSTKGFRDSINAHNMHHIVTFYTFDNDH